MSCGNIAGPGVKCKSLKVFDRDSHVHRTIRTRIYVVVYDVDLSHMHDHDASQSGFFRDRSDITRAPCKTDRQCGQCEFYLP